MNIPKWAVWVEPARRRDAAQAAWRELKRYDADVPSRVRAMFAAGQQAVDPAAEGTARQLAQAAGYAVVDPRLVVPVSNEQRQRLAAEAMATPEWGLRAWASGALGTAAGWELTAKQLIAGAPERPRQPVAPALLLTGLAVAGSLLL